VEEAKKNGSRRAKNDGDASAQGTSKKRQIDLVVAHKERGSGSFAWERRKGSFIGRREVLVRSYERKE